MSRIQDEVIFSLCKDAYKNAVVELKKTHNLQNDLMIPKCEAVYISVGAGKFFTNAAEMEKIQKAVSYIAGQKAVLTTAKKSVAAFNVREGMKTGIKVTLRKNKMYEFLDRLKIIYLPRMREFQGLNEESFNGRTFSIGIKDSASVFPEIVSIMNTYDFTFGMNITLVFNICEISLQKDVLKLLGFPFSKDN